MKFMKSLLLCAAAACALQVAPAQSQQFIPILSYRVGPYAAGGSGYFGGAIDYFNLVNLNGGINGVKITYEECETEYNAARGVECYERLKSKNGGASTGETTSKGSPRGRLALKATRQQGAAAHASEVAPPKNYYGIRLGPYKYIEWPDGEKELYDVNKDPYELNNIVRDKNYAPIRAFLHNELVRLEECSGRTCQEVAEKLPLTKRDQLKVKREKEKEQREREREREKRERERERREREKAHKH